MTKLEFLSELVKRLDGREDRSNIVAYYREMIDDRIDDGMSEEEAVAAMGSIDDICREYPAPERRTAAEPEPKEKNEEKSSSSSASDTIIKVVTVFASVIVTLVYVGLLVGFWTTAISICVSGVALAIAAIPALLRSVGGGLISLGVGIALVGISIIGFQLIKVFSHFAGKLMKEIKVKIGGEASK